MNNENETYLRFLRENEPQKSFFSSEENSTEKIIPSTTHIKVRAGLCFVEEKRVLFRDSLDGDFYEEDLTKNGINQKANSLVVFLHNSQISQHSLGKKYKAKELASRFGVSEKTVFNLISNLNILFEQKYKLKIILNSQREGYYFNLEIL